MKKSSKGFSLIELLIVVAITLIIAAIAIPNLLRSRIAANQASAVGSLRTLNTAEITYSTTFNTGFSTTLGQLGPPAAGNTPTSSFAGLIDEVLSGIGTAGTVVTTNVSAKSGYNFSYTPGATDATGRIDSYSFIAVPVSTNTGTNYYYTDQSGVLRQNSTTTATSSDSPIAG